MEGEFYRVVKKLPPPWKVKLDHHFYGFELESDFWRAVNTLHKQWGGETGLLVGKRGDLRQLRFFNRYGGRDDVWLYSFMLRRTAEAPPYMPRPMTEEEELDAMLYDVFGFDWWKED